MAQKSHIVFIHGLANKPAPADLRRIWLESLAEAVDGDDGFGLSAVGVADSFVYWANHFYDEPLAAGDYESRADAVQQSVAEDVELPDDAWMQAMREEFGVDEEEPFEDAPVAPDTEEYERIPLPAFAKNRLMKHFLKEAHAYLFNVDGIRDTIRTQVTDALNAIGSDSLKVLVGHSQGSMIAYDVLTGDDRCPQVDGLLTLGSPLGVDEVQDRLVWTRENGFPARLAGDWVNVFDPFDVVARADPKLANDFRKNGERKVIDIKESNWGKWRHSATKYFKGPQLRKALRRLAGRE